MSHLRAAFSAGRVFVVEFSIMQVTTFSQASFRQASRYLLAMRGVILVAEFFMLGVTRHLALLPQGIRFALMTTIAHGAMALAAVAWLKYRPPQRPWAISLSLLADLLLMGLWLHFTGGYTNPLTSLLLLPLAMAVILVPMGQSLLLAAASVLTYGGLMSWYAPVIVRHHDGAYLERLHLEGMWIAFVLTAIVLLLVVGSLVTRFRDLQITLARAREERLRDEQIIALGLSAATAAHRIGTPLNTMTLLINEMRHEPRAQPLADDIQLLEDQVRVCTDHLRQLSASAALVEASDLESISLERWLARLRESATLLWPASGLGWIESVPPVRVSVDATLDQAVLNILANALRASPDYVRVSARQSCGQVALEIEDHGDGLQERVEKRPGEEVIASESGLGIGLFLSNATIQRLGGELRARVADSGTTMTILLPELDDEQ